MIVGVNLPHGFFGTTETGFRYRQSPVPDDFFGNASAGKVVKHFNFIGSYITSRSINGLDILGPGIALRTQFTILG